MRGCDLLRIKVPCFFSLKSFFLTDSPRSDLPLSIVRMDSPLLRLHLILYHFVSFRQPDQCRGGRQRHILFVLLLMCYLKDLCLVWNL